MADTIRLGAQMAQQYFTCTVLDIPAGSPPLEILVRLPTIDSPANLALWFGSPPLQVGDSVICRRDPNDQDMLIVESLTGATPSHSHSHDTDLTDISPDDHHNQSHVLAGPGGLGTDHTVSGLTAGQYLRATAAAAAAFQAIPIGDLPITTTIGSPGVDTLLTTEQGVREELDNRTWPGEGKAMIGAVVYSTLTAALAAASAGDVIKLGPGTFNEPELNPADDNLIIVGSGKDITVISLDNNIETNVFFVSNLNITFMDLTLDRVDTPTGGDVTALNISVSTGSKVVNLYNVRISLVIAGGSDNSAAIVGQGNGTSLEVNLVNVDVTVSSGGAVQWIFRKSGTHIFDANIYGGTYQSDGDFSSTAVSDQNVHAFGFHLIAGAIDGDTVIDGYYLDSNLDVIATGLQLGAGATVDTIATTVGDPGVDTAVVTEQGIREALDAQAFIGLEDNAGTPIVPDTDDRIQVTDDSIINADAAGNTLALSINAATTVGDPGDDTTLVTEQGIREALDLARGFVVENTSGAAVSAGDIGYIDEAGEFKTTTTAADPQMVGDGCLVLVGGANNADITVVNSGSGLVNYTGSAPAQGDFLVSSTTAGDAQAQTTMHPNIFAVCTAAGSGGQVGAVLRVGNTPKEATNSNDIFRVGSTSDSDFMGTINGSPSGTSVVYNAPSSGDEANLVPNSTSQLAKMVLHNTTRGNSALISDCNTGTNTITLTTTVPGDWADTDTITIRSQTNTSNPQSGVYFVDFEFTSGIEALTRSIVGAAAIADSAAASQSLWLHPYETNVNSKRNVPVTTYVAGVTTHGAAMPLNLIDNKFCAAWDANGTGTLTVVLLRLYEIEVATP